MASYKLLIKPSASKDLEAPPKKDRKRVVTRIQSLARNPRPPGCEKLSGHDLFRVRQGTYRFLYIVQDPEMVVVIISIGHRREAYR